MLIKRSLVAAFLAFFAVAIPASEPAQYLCITEDETGFNWENGKWGKYENGKMCKRGNGVTENAGRTRKCRGAVDTRVQGNGPAQLHGYFCGHGVGIGHPAHAVCAEKLSHDFFVSVS